METERFLLRRWKQSDAEMLFQLASDPEVGPRAGWAPHQNVEESREVIARYFDNEQTWAIEWKSTGEVVGCIGYLVNGQSNIDIGEKDAELGYWIGKPYWNKGICTEALKLIIDYCFHVKNIPTLWCDYFIDNPASGRVMGKCGFKDTGEMHYCLNLVGGNDRPVKIMRLNK